MLSAFTAVVTLAVAAELVVIPPERAREFAGREAVVKGLITQVGESKDGRILFLNLGGTYPHQAFNAVVFRARSPSFREAQFWQGKHVRVSGRIQLYKGKGMPEIVVEREDQLTIDEPPLAPSAPATDTGPVMDFDTPPRVIKQARPQYPQEAFVQRIEGTVLIEALLDTQGRVARARVIQSVPTLDAAALAACYGWVFQPAYKNGQPVATVIHMPVSFRIHGKKLEQRKQRPARKH